MSASTSSHPTTDINPTVGNAVKLIGESFLPGASLLMDGKILAGGAHMLLGAWAKAALGPVGLALVIANSYATASTGKNLIKQFTKAEPNHDTKSDAVQKASS